jgi:teichuronic acid exporter
MDVADRIRAGIKWLALGKIGSQLIVWIFTIITIRILTPDDYGLLAIASIFMLFLSLFEELGLRARLVQLEQVDHDYARTVYGISIIANLVIALLLVAFAPLVALLFAEPRMTPILWTLSLLFVVGSLSAIPEAMINRALDFRSVAIIEVVQKSLAAALTLALAWLGCGYWALVGGMVASRVIRTAGLMWASPFHAWPLFRFRGLGGTLAFGGHITGQGLIWWAFISYDQFLIGRLFGPHVLGIYSVALDLAYAPLAKVGSTISSTSFTGLSRVASDPQMFRDYLQKGMRVLVVITFPLFFGMSAVAVDVIPLLLGPNWSPAAPIMAVLCLSMPFRAMTPPLVASLNSLGLPHIALRATMWMGVLVVAAVSIGIAWGPVGVATGWLVAAVLGTGLTAGAVVRQKRLFVADLARCVLPACGAATVMLAVVHLARAQLPLGTSVPFACAMEIMLGAAVYATLIAVLDRPGLRLARSMVWRR